MVGNIIHKGNNEKEYPLVLTEAEFLEILNKGIYTYNLLGHQVALSNSQATSGTNPNYLIVDVNHDSNQLNTYDLMAMDCVYSSKFGSNQYWRDSIIRTWLNNTYFNGFSSNIQSHIVNIRYDSLGTFYTDDKIVIPSVAEISGSKRNDGSMPTSYLPIEGSLYPVLPSFIRKYTGSIGVFWWTRTKYNKFDDPYDIWVVHNDGLLNVNYWNDTYYVVPLFRVQ